MFKLVVDTIKREGFSFRKKVSFSVITFLMSFFFFIPSVSASSGLDFTTPLKWVIFLIIAGMMLIRLGFGVVTRLPFFLVVGFLLLFIIGGYVQAGNILIPSAETYQVYGNNFTDNAVHWDNVHSGDAPDFSDKTLNDPKGVFLFHESKQFELISFSQSHIVGLFLMVISVFAMMFSLFIGIGGGSY